MDLNFLIKFAYNIQIIDSLQTLGLLTSYLFKIQENHETCEHITMFTINFTMLSR